VRSTLGDSQPVGYVAQADTGVAGDAQQGEAIVREELPLGLACHAEENSLKFDS
jgi:hypothetical protein